MPELRSRRSVLVGLMGGVLAACGEAGRSGSSGRTHTVAQPSAGQPTPPPAAPAPVELVWHTDGGPNRLHWPTGLAVDRLGTVTVVDAGNDRLVQVTSAGA